MTLKEKKFVEHYIIDGNGTQAVKKAGYGRKNKELKETVAATIAKENIRKPHIKKEIDKRLREIEAETDVTLKEIIHNARYLINLGISNKNGGDIAAGNLQLGKTIGAYQDNLNTTDTIKAQELANISKEEAIELKRIANIRLSEMTQDVDTKQVKIG